MDAENITEEKEIESTSVEAASGLSQLASELKPSEFSIIKMFKKYFNKTLEDIGLRSSKRIGKSVKNKDGSVTHEMWFAYSAGGKDYEVPLYINGKPTDSSRKQISLSFKYVAPEDLL